jgi:ABC-type Zn uptake system ZnuABC Zn-binding protein ZnuA
MRTPLLSLLAAALTTGAAPGRANHPAPAPATAPLRIVTSLTTYASIAREIVGDKAMVTAIAQGDEDPHFVQPRPSFVAVLRDADVFVTTGMDLELWVPTLLDRAGNAKVREGGPGYVAAHTGITLLEVPASLSRAQGDIHVDGNPHIHTDPINAILIARNILAGLARVSPTAEADFGARERDFEARILKATFGEELVQIVTAPTLVELARAGKLMPFLENTKFKGQPLVTRLGGWMKTGLAFRGKQMVCYHKEWAYFSNRYGVDCVEYIEAKPGIPPTPRHVQDVIALMRDKKIPVLFASNYFDHKQIADVASRTGATAVIVPENTNGAPGVDTYFDLMDTWVNGLARAFAGAGR